MKIDLGGKMTDFTFDTLYIPNKEQFPELNNITFNVSKRPYFHRFQRYNTTLLNSLTYSQVVRYFFDRYQFPNILVAGGSTKNKTANDDVMRQNIYTTLYYLFPTGYPSVNNIYFSYNKIAGTSTGFTPITRSIFSSPSIPTNIGNPLKAITDIGDKVAKGNGITDFFKNMFKTTKHYSYLKSDNTYTISEVVWKNDIYNHPVYKKLLASVYKYVSWGYRFRTLKTSFEGMQFDRIDKLIMDERRSFIKELRSFIRSSSQYIANKSYKKISELISATKLDYELNIIVQEAAEVKEAAAVKEAAVQEAAADEEILTLIADYGYNYKDKDIKNKDDYKKNLKEAEKKIKEAEKKIKELYDTGVVDEFKKLHSFIKRGNASKRDSTTYVSFSLDSLLKEFAKYIYFLDIREALEDFKMAPIQKATTRSDTIYLDVFKSNSEMASVRKLYNEDYESFKKDLGGDEGTNTVLNAIIYEYMTGQNNTLAKIAIWYYDYVLQDHSLHLDESKYAEIAKEVETLNNNWENIYTGIRSDYNSNSTSKSSNMTVASNEYTIYLSMNAFDQELNDETVETFKCYLLNNSMGPLLDYLTSANYSNDTSLRQKYMIQSIVQHIPNKGKTSLKDEARNMSSKKAQKGNLAQKGKKPIINQKGPLRQQGGLFSKKRKNKGSLNRTYKRIYPLDGR